MPWRARRTARRTANTPPYFYVWTKSIDESKDQASQFGGGELKISLDLYNATLDVPVGVRKAFSSVRNHKTGRAYFRDAGVGADISISASNYFAPNFVYNDRYFLHHY